MTVRSVVTVCVVLIVGVVVAGVVVVIAVVGSKTQLLEVFIQNLPLNIGKNW